MTWIAFGPWTLKVEQVFMFGLDIVTALPQVVIDPECAATEQQQLVISDPCRNALGNDLAIPVGVDRMLRLVDGEVVEIVHRHIREQLQHIRAAEAPLPQEGPVADIAGVLPRHALVTPIGVFGLSPARGEIALRRSPEEVKLRHSCSPMIRRAGSARGIAGQGTQSAVVVSFDSDGACGAGGPLPNGITLSVVRSSCKYFAAP
jgi:hypothetical protein